MEINIAVFYDNYDFANRIEYVFYNIFRHSFLKNYNIKLSFNPKLNDKYNYKISYTSIPTENSFHIKTQNILFKNNITDSKALFANKYIYKKNTLYSVEGIHEKESKSFYENKTFNFDIVETIFFHLSRYEEYFAKKEQVDHHDRMKSEEQFLVRYNLNKIPVVDHLIYAFLSILGFDKLDVKTTFSVTHDIDAIKKFPSFYKFLRAFARIIKKEKSLNLTKKLINQYYNVRKFKQDPYDTFDWILQNNKSEEKVIYFMSGGITKYDNFYSIKDEKLKKIIDLSLKNNYTIGLHPSYISPLKQKQFIKEINLLRDVIKKNIFYSRQHILHFYFDKTIDILENIGIKYDSSLGYQDLIGFRCGIGNNFYLYNFNKEQISSVVEIPLVVMDGPLLMEANYNIQKAKNIIFDFLEKNKEFTKITFNFHNSSFDNISYDGDAFKELYFELNKYFGYKNE